MSKVTSNILKKTLNNTLQETITGVIQKSIREGIQESSETTIKKVITKNLNTMVQKNIDDLLSDNLPKIYKDSLNEILTETSEDLVSSNIKKTSKDLVDDLAKKNPEFLKSLIVTQRENLGPTLQKLIKESLESAVDSPNITEGLRKTLVKSSNDKVVKSLDNISPNPSSLSKSDNILKEELASKIKQNKGVKDTLSSSYEKAREFISNNKRLLFKVAGVAAAIGAKPLMALILDQIADKETNIGNVTKIKYINPNTLEITVNYQNPIKFCPNDSIKVKYFNGVTPNIDNTEYKVNIISNDNDKIYVLKLSGTPTVFSVDEDAKGQINSTYGFYDQLGCNLVTEATPPDGGGDSGGGDGGGNIPSDEITPIKKNNTMLFVIISVSIILLIFLFYFLKK